jgi:hypothetical protein
MTFAVPTGDNQPNNKGPVHVLNAECIATAIDRIRMLRFH